MSKLSITRALALVKKYRKQITKEEENFSPAKVFTNGVARDGQNSEEFLSNATRSLEKFRALNDNINKIKGAIAKANAVSTLSVKLKNTDILKKEESVQVDGTVIYFINLKDQLTAQHNFYQKLYRTSFEKSLSDFDKANRNLEDLIEKSTNSILGSNKQISKNSVSELVEQIKSQNEIKLVSPFGSADNLLSLISTLQDNIDEIDLALSEFNSKTEIEVEGL